MSTGLPFPPGRNASTLEVIELCKIVAEYGGFYTSHMRDTTDHCIEAAMEFIEICERSGIRGFMSHLYCGFSWNHGKPIAILRMIDKAREKGLDVTFDFTPNAPMIDGCFLGRAPTRSTTYKELSRTELLKEWKDPEKWRKFKQDIVELHEKNRQIAKKRGDELLERGFSFGFSEREIHLVNHLKLMIGYSKTRPDLHGKNLEEAAKLTGKPDWLEFVRDLYLADEGYATCGGNNVAEADVIEMLKHPMGMISTDTWQRDFSKDPWSNMVERLDWFFLHSWSMIHTLERYVREMKVISLEEAVRKMTSLPAQTLNLKDRGVLREGNWADIVVFDAENVKENATWENTSLYPSGIPYVLVNGEVVVDGGRHTGALPGKVLNHKL
jgi:N-acyl-D-aspartate/D-glutamate deacylase